MGVRVGKWLCLALLGGLVTPLAQAARIGEITQTNWQSQAIDFLTFSNPAVMHAIFGSLFLGTVCGLMGCFILVRKLALLGDTLSHAVLPGVALGFVWNMTKDPVAIFIGAVIAGLLGTVMTQLIRQTTILKEDTSLGLVLGGFYGIGIVLMRMVMNLEEGNKAGLDKFLFGQAAALSRGDVVVMGIIAVVTVLLVYLLYKELLVTSFDIAFARALGLPAQWIHYLVMILLAFAVVVALQAVGVVLVSAMLITPAAAAYLLTDRLSRMLLLAALFGAGAGLVGAFTSYLSTGLPTGPFMVLAATGIFIIAFFFGPRYGLVSRIMLKIMRQRRIQVENTLKAIFQVRERGGFKEEGVTLSDLAARRNVDGRVIEQEVRRLERGGFALIEAERLGILERSVFLTPRGWEQACKVVRNHRLWELYLTNAAKLQADHVHEDAEIIEHVLGDDIVMKLERRLDFPSRDPHGKLIPGQKDMERGFILSDEVNPVEVLP